MGEDPMPRRRRQSRGQRGVDASIDGGADEGANKETDAAADAVPVQAFTKALI